MSQVHPLIEGVEEICNRHRILTERDELFESLYERIRANWTLHREPDRWPTAEKNWVLRLAPQFTHHPTQRLEKQLQKQIAICLENEGWGNDVPTASGLVNSHGRQMNVDLAHRITDGYELIELKLESNTPYDAALQILRYGAVYMLYRLEPELARRFKLHRMMCAKRVVLEVLAPPLYYLKGNVALGPLEAQLDRQVRTFAKRRTIGLELSFRFTAFPANFVYRPGMDGDFIRNAVRRRRRLYEIVQIKSYTGQQIRSFGDWNKHALPPDRRERHWKEGRSEFELGRVWTANGEPIVPPELAQLLDSHEETKGVVIISGVTQHETPLPFSTHGPRCHDLALRGERDGCLITICIEAKADESFGGPVAEELRKARQRPETTFPERLDWLTRSLLGLPAFVDEERLILSDVISMLPYQLLSAIGGTLLEAKLQNATMAIFVVHEFRTTATVDVKMEANASALSSFLRLLDRTNNAVDRDLQQLPAGEMIGPISILEHPAAGAVKMPCHIPLFVGKIRTDRLRMVLKITP